MNDRKIGRAPDFTSACVVMFGVNLGWIFLFLFAVYGLFAAVFLALAVNHWVNWLEQRKREVAQRYAKKITED